MVNKKDDIQIKGVPKDIYEQLENIASNSNIKIATLLRVDLTQIIQAYPDFLKQISDGGKEPLSQRGKPVVVRNMPKGIKDEIDNIAKKIGTTSSSLLKIHLSSIIQKYPAHMRRKD